jgi:hypothetical protein
MNYPLLPTLAVLAALGAAASVHAQEATLPSVKAGDKWVYNVTIDAPPKGSTTRKWESSVVRAGSSGVVLARKPVDSNLPPKEIAIETDWSRRASINGKLTTVAKNFDFPLRVGKTWELAVTDEKPNDKVKLAKRTYQYRVVGWEEIKVAAGTFNALKIEADGEWYAEFLPTNAVAGSRLEAGAAGSRVIAESHKPTTPKPATGKYYKAFWYVPEVKREVKSVEETFSSQGNISNRTTAELDSFQVQP